MPLRGLLCPHAQCVYYALPNEHRYLNSFQSVSQTLHTATAGVLAQLLTLHAGHKDGDGTFMLTRRVMTALIHHCKGAEQFSAVGDLLVGRLSSLTETSSLEPVETPLARIIDVVSVAASVRQGSRLTSTLLLTMVSSSHS